MNKNLITALTIIGMLFGAALLYANVAYFPMDRGVVIEDRMKNLPDKVDKILAILETQ